MKERKKLQLTYPMIKRILVAIHILACMVFVGGVIMLYSNDNFKKGISRLNNEDYEDSSVFIRQLETDLEYLFDYIDLNVLFERGGSFNPEALMFSINVGPGMDVDYSVFDVIRFAKKRGIYLDESYQIAQYFPEEDDTLPMNTQDEEERDWEEKDSSYLVNWKSYESSRNLTEPGDAYETLDNLCLEVLERLSRYYAAYENIRLIQRNLYYRVEAGAKQYTNNPDLQKENLKSYGRYLSMTSASLLAESNLIQIPENLVYRAQNMNTSSSSYTVLLAVDTLYPAQDAYYFGNTRYRREREMYFYGMMAVGLSLLLLLLSFLGLVFFVGKKEKSSPERILLMQDRIQIEINILLCMICITTLMFLAEKVAFKLIHLLMPQSIWYIMELMLMYIIIYICVFITFFSALRAFKAGILWENSLLRHMKDDRVVSSGENRFSKRQSLHFLLYASVNLVSILILALLFRQNTTLVYRFLLIGLVVALLAFDAWVFHDLFRNSREMDEIALAIEKISRGDTAYKLEVENFGGQEAEIARSLNDIGHWLEDAISDQVKSERLKADLITNVSHDIKTPLTSIINYIDLIKREKIENPRVKEYLKVLEQKSLHLKNLTEDLVEASKVSSGNMTVEIREIDFAELVQQANGEFEEKFLEKGLHLVSNVPKGAVKISADGRHLWRVLENLYINTVKYAAYNSRVYVTLCSTEEKAVFTIKNVSAMALNISPEELTERFVRGDVSRSTEGSGLGLSIAKSLTALQGGEFEIIIDGDLFKVVLSFRR